MPERLPGHEFAAKAFENERNSPDIGAFYGITLDALKTAVETGHLVPQFEKSFNVTVLGEPSDKHGEDYAFDDEARKASVWSALEPIFVKHPALRKKASFIYNYAAFPTLRTESGKVEKRKLTKKGGMSDDDITQLEECEFPDSGVVIGISKDFLRQTTPADQTMVTGNCLKISQTVIDFADIVAIEPLNDDAYNYLIALQEQLNA